jgi:hypothetical protein
MYRIHLYRGSKLVKTEVVDAPLEEAKEAAAAALGTGQHHRVELLSSAGHLVFQRWAVL